MNESPARQTGRISIHPRGFGFLNLEGPEGEWIAFITPPDLNPFLDGDLVSAVVTVTGPEGGRGGGGGGGPPPRGGRGPGWSAGAPGSRAPCPRGAPAASSASIAS